MTVRVIQWATGAMGRIVLRRLIEHPGFDVVGAFVFDEAKAGRDIGSLAGSADIGVVATSDRSAIMALDADVVVHAARINDDMTFHDDDIIGLLESGKNVITINGMSAPGWWGDERVAALAAAGRRGGSTVMPAGLNPGFAVEQLAVLATGLCTSVESIAVNEVVDTTVMRDPTYVFEVLGFGADPDAIDPNARGWLPAELLNPMYTEVLVAAAERLGVDLDRVDTDHRVFPAVRDLEVGAGSILAGTVARTCWRWHGVVGEQRFITLSIEWTMEPDAVVEVPTWHVEITGDPCVVVDLDLRKHPDDHRRTTAEQYALAGAVLNAIPSVMASAPGIAPSPLAVPWQRWRQDD